MEREKSSVTKVHLCNIDAPGKKKICHTSIPWSIHYADLIKTKLNLNTEACVFLVQGNLPGVYRSIYSLSAWSNMGIDWRAISALSLDKVNFSVHRSDNWSTPSDLGQLDQKALYIENS